MNDPVAVLLTVGMVEVWRSDPSALDWTLFLVAQLGAGVAVGIGVGVLGRWVVTRITGPAVSSLGVITLAVAGISYGSAALVGGSGFLAVYLTGVVVATSRRAAREVLYFHEGLAATAQGVLFLVLGILVFPSTLPDNLATAIVIAATLTLLARPIAVVAVLAWSRTPPRRMAVISWAGLRGAVPVVLATIPFTAGHPDGALIFDATFVVVVLAVAVQGPTVGILARRLGVVAEQRVTVRPEILPIDALDADIVEITVPPGSPLNASALRDTPPPDGSRVAIIRRGNDTIIPRGHTRLAAHDVLLLITPKRCDLDQMESWCRAGPDSQSSDAAADTDPNTDDDARPTH